MHKLPAFVFKLLGASIMLMFLLDTALVVVDTLTVHSRVITLAGIMQNEVARNNCMPTVLATEFNKQLTDIVKNSRVADDTIVTNFRNNVVKDSITYKSLAEKDALQYGQIADLYIEITMSPTVVYLNTTGDSGSFLKKGILSYTLTYSYSVPCLRYIK